jgi:hypothetical protein
MPGGDVGDVLLFVSVELIYYALETLGIGSEKREVGISGLLGTIEGFSKDREHGFEVGLLGFIVSLSASHFRR